MVRRKSDEQTTAVLDAPVEVPSLADVRRRRTREALATYRDAVSKVSSDVTLSQAETERVADAADRLGLPMGAFELDVKAVGDFRRTQAKLDELDRTAPQRRDRERLLVVEIKDAERRLAELRSEAHKLEVVSGMKAVAYGQTLNELRNRHPLTLQPIETALSILSDRIGGAS